MRVLSSADVWFCACAAGCDAEVMRRQMWITLSVNIQDEVAKGGMALAGQIADCLLVLWLRPYVETSTEFVKTIGEFSNMLTYLTITLPLLSGFETPEWMVGTCLKAMMRRALGDATHAIVTA